MTWPPDTRVCSAPRCTEPSARTLGVEDARCITHALPVAQDALRLAKAHLAALTEAAAVMPGQGTLL